MRSTFPPLPNGIARTLDPVFLTTVANHPSVRPWLGGDGPMDLSALVRDPLNLAGITEHGGFVCVQQGAGRYEVHSLFLPERPRTETIQGMRAATDYFFAATDGLELVTKVPQKNIAALALARIAGFELLFSSDIQFTSTERCLADFLSLSVDRWALRSACAELLGGWLHQEFDRVRSEHGSELPEHSAEDDTHLRMAGAAVLMIRAGQHRKGIEFYNRWARLTAYPTIKLLRESPVVIDLDGIIIETRGAEVEILSCQ